MLTSKGYSRACSESSHFLTVGTLLHSMFDNRSVKVFGQEDIQMASLPRSQAEYCNDRTSMETYIFAGPCLIDGQYCRWLMISLAQPTCKRMLERRPWAQGHCCLHGEVT